MNMESKLGVSLILLLVNTFISQLAAESCFTSRNEYGECKDIYQCPVMRQVLQAKPLSTESIQYLQSSQCNAKPGYPISICCPSGPGVQTPSTLPPPNIGLENPGSPNYNLRNNPLLPSNCGEQTSDRIMGGERTDIDEFPWVALLVYRKPVGTVTGCSGVLISKRYVLTAAHCLKGKTLPTDWKLSMVRLGEYDTTQEIDCITTADYDVCADPTVSITIEEQIVHENYIPASREQRNDIALLRLSRDVTFTHYIQPICLPEESNVGQLLDVAGWGVTESGYNSNVKLKVKVPLVTNEDCHRIYLNNASLQLGSGQMCAGGGRGRDSCKGDSGGPLMMMAKGPNDDQPRWGVRGVVSFGVFPCGLEGWPGVYTKIYDFIPWILRNMRQ